MKPVPSTLTLPLLSRPGWHPVALGVLLNLLNLGTDRCAAQATENNGVGRDKAILAAAAEGGSSVEDPVQSGAERIHRELARAGATVAQAFGSARREVNRAHLSFQGASSLRTLVVPRPDATEEQLNETREQLAIMSRILTKAADPEASGHGSFRFRLVGLDFNAGTDLDAMALDGYGALFQVSVDFPLVEVAKAAEKKVPATADKDATWERTRRELSGTASDDHQAEDESDGVTAPPFDADRVAALRKRLIESLRHASNLKFLHEGAERVTIIVSGRGTAVTHAAVHLNGGASATTKVVGYVKDDKGMQVWDLNGGRRTQQLTLSAKKGDIDAFAAGRMTVEEFTRKVIVTTQARVAAVQP